MEKKEVITGRNPVIEYLKSPADTTGMELHVSSGAHGAIIDEIVSICRKKNIEIFSEDKSFFSRFSSSSAHQGVALFVVGRKNRENGNTPDILTRTADEKGVIVLLDQVTDPHNVGSIIRSAEALGCRAVILPRNNSAGITDTVIKSSAGATAHIELIHINNVAVFLDELKKKGFWIIGTSDHGAVRPEEIKGILPACIVIGSEGKGMRRLTEEKCDYTVAIPLKGNVSSLNASVAAGIIIYEIMKGN